MQHGKARRQPEGPASSEREKSARSGSALWCAGTLVLLVQRYRRYSENQSAGEERGRRAHLRPKHIVSVSPMQHRVRVHPRPQPSVGSSAVDSISSCHTEEGIVGVRVAGIIIRSRVPKAPQTHSSPLAALLTDRDLDHELVAREVEL
jgi:hypothetical protein